MAKSLEFGKSVLVMDADDTKLEAALKADEQLVTQSVNKMQGNLDKLEVSMQGTGSAAGVATTGLTTLSTAAAVTGSRSLSLISQVGQLGYYLQEMGNKALGAKAQLIALMGATWAYIAANIAATGVLAGLVAAIVAVRMLKSRAAQKEIEDQERLQEISGRVQTRIEAELKYRDRLAALQQKTAVIYGVIGAFEARFYEIRRSNRELSEKQIEDLIDAERALAQATALVQQAEQDETVATARQAKLDSLRNQLDLLTGQVSKYDLIADAEERAAQRALDRVLAEKQVTDQIEAQQRAKAAQFEPKGPSTMPEAEKLVWQSLQLAEANQRSGALVRDAVEKLKLLGIDSATLETIAQSLGAGATGGKPTIRFGQGAIELSAFAGTGRRGAGAAGPDPIQSARIAKEDKRTKAAEATARNTERLAEAFGRWRTGAG